MTKSHRFTLLQSRPWVELNEYEGELEVMLGAFTARPFTVYTMLGSPGAWKEMDTEIVADLVLLRFGDVDVVPTETFASVHCIDGSTFYDVTGVVREVGAGYVWLDLCTDFALCVDLDPVSGVTLPELVVGGCIRVRGRLEIEFG